MQISDLIIGLMAFVATALVSISLMNTMYDINDVHSYKVNLSDNQYTAGLSTVYTDLQETQAANKVTSDTIYDKMAGEPSATTSGSTSTTSSDAWISAGLTLTNLGSYVTATYNLILSFVTVLGVSKDAAPIVFIIGAIIISVALTIIGIVFFRPL